MNLIRYTISIPEICLIRKLNVGSVEDRIFSLSFLPGVVLQAPQSRTGQDDDDWKVDERQKAHDDIRRTPGHAELHEGAAEDHDSGEDPEEEQYFFSGLLVAEVAKAHLRVEIVADQGCEGEQEQGDGDKGGAEASQSFGRGCLYPGHALQLITWSYAGAKEHKGCGRADHDGINEHGEHLYKPLLDRVGDGGAGGRIRGGTDAGLIGEKSSLDTLHDAGACKAAKDGLEIKGVCKNIHEHLRYQAEVCHNDEEGYCQIEDTHDRDKYTGDL